MSRITKLYSPSKTAFSWFSPCIRAGEAKSYVEPLTLSCSVFCGLAKPISTYLFISAITD